MDHHFRFEFGKNICQLVPVSDISFNNPAVSLLAGSPDIVPLDRLIIVRIKIIYDEYLMAIL